MVKVGLEIKVASRIATARKTREQRDASLTHKQYREAMGQLSAVLDEAVKKAEKEPELGLMVARQCCRFVLEAIPDPILDPGRATALSQFRVLEHCLAEVRKPAEYLAAMIEQFGSNLDPREYKAGQDAFSSIIKSQRQKLYTEGQGFNTADEKIFCRKRSELLATIEKAYTHLRTEALGVTSLK